MPTRYFVTSPPGRTATRVWQVRDSHTLSRVVAQLSGPDGQRIINKTCDRLNGADSRGLMAFELLTLAECSGSGRQGRKHMLRVGERSTKTGHPRVLWMVCFQCGCNCAAAFVMPEGVDRA